MIQISKLHTEMMRLKHKFIQLQLSKSLSHSIYILLKTIHLNAKKKKIQNEEIEVIQVNDLYDQFNVSRPAISKLLKECEKKDLIHKYMSEIDKRYMLISLTEKGEKTLEKAEREVDESVKWIIAHFSEQELDEFLKFMIKANDVLDEFNRKED